MTIVDEYGFTFDPRLAEDLRTRWLITDLLVTRVPGSRERDALRLALDDTRKAELDLLDSVRPCPEIDTAHLRGKDPDDEESPLRPAGDPPAVVADWRALNAEPAAPSAPVKPRRHFTLTEKVAAVRLAQQTNRAEASRQLGIHVSQIKDWSTQPAVVAALRDEKAAAVGPPSLVDRILAEQPAAHAQAPIPKRSFDPEAARMAAIDNAFTSESGYGS